MTSTAQRIRAGPPIRRDAEHRERADHPEPDFGDAEHGVTGNDVTTVLGIMPSSEKVRTV